MNSYLRSKNAVIENVALCWCNALWAMQQFWMGTGWTVNSDNLILNLSFIWTFQSRIRTWDVSSLYRIPHHNYNVLKENFTNHILRAKPQQQLVISFFNRLLLKLQYLERKPHRPWLVFMRVLYPRQTRIGLIQVPS